MNTWAVSLIRFGAGIVKWMKSKTDKIDRKTRKVMKMNKELHPRCHVDSMYLGWREEKD